MHKPKVLFISLVILGLVGAAVVVAGRTRIWSDSEEKLSNVTHAEQFAAFINERNQQIAPRARFDSQFSRDPSSGMLTGPNEIIALQAEVARLEKMVELLDKRLKTLERN